MEDSLSEFPKGWVRTTLGEISGNVERVNPQSQPNKEFIYLDIASIDNNLQKIIDHKKYLGKDAPSRARQVVKSGDILFSTVRTYLKNIAVVKDIYDGQIASTGFCVIRPLSPVDERLIFWLILTDDFLNPLNQLQRGTSYPAVRDSDVFSQTIPLPPLPEQHRIVSKIEEVFTKLDAGVEALKKVKAQLKRYRQAVLKYVFEGKLTQEWREANKDKLEPASALLEKIKEERRNNAKGKLKEFSPLNTSGLSELPKEWAWTRLGEISLIILGQSPPSSTYNENGEGLPFYQGKLEFGEIYPVPQKWCSSPKKIAEKGDVLISVRAPVGPTNICPGKSCIGRGLAALRGMGGISPFFILYLIRAFENNIAQKGTGTTFNAITGDQLNEFRIPLPSLIEQNKIVENIESCFSIAHEVEKIAEQTLKQSKRLRQSILKTTFEGKLVPQDPTDEPAEKLLERIKAEKDKKELETKGRRK